MRKVWSFELGRVRVALHIEQEPNYEYDGDDPKGETQAAIDGGDMFAFRSVVTVEVDGEELGSDHLGGSVYYVDRVAEFWTAHRTSSPEYRNTLAQKAQGRCIGHYFPGMVSEAISQARAELEARRA